MPRFVPGFFPTNLPIADGLAFVGVTGGGQIPSQSITFQCLRGCSAPTATTSSGGNWLTAKATASNAVAETLTVSVMVAGLSPGAYFGKITTGSSVSLTIVFNVVAANVDPGPILTPIGLVFVAPQGSGQTSAQTITLYNITNSPVTYTSTNPAGSGTIGASPVTVPISYNVAGQPPGTFSGDTHFTFSDGFQADVIGRVVVTPSAALGVNRPDTTRPSGCTPMALTVTVTSLGPQNNLGVGFPVPIDAEVKDSPCGNPVTSTNVSATFSSEATTVQMSPDPSTPGLYDGSWTPRTTAANAQITVTASASNLSSASQTVTREVVGSQAPVISSGGLRRRIHWRAWWGVDSR